MKVNPVHLKCNYEQEWVLSDIFNKGNNLGRDYVQAFAELTFYHPTCLTTVDNSVT